MQSIETRLQTHLDNHNMPLGLIKISTEIAQSTSHSASRKEPGKQDTHTAKSSLPKKSFSYKLSQEVHFQAKHYISLIKDPLWKRVCAEAINIIGPLFILKIWNSRLGSPQDKIIDLYCPTEEAAQFTQQYAFVVIGILQQYFPALKELKVIVPS